MQGILSVVNCFSGAVFLAVGLLHLLPHVIEYEALSSLDTDYPVGLAVVLAGFALILFMEQVLFGFQAAPQSSTEDTSKSRSAGCLQGVTGRFKGPMITQLAVILHAVLESITMGLAVRSCPLSRSLYQLVPHDTCMHKRGA